MSVRLVYVKLCSDWWPCTHSISNQNKSFDFFFQCEWVGLTCCRLNRWRNLIFFWHHKNSECKTLFSSHIWNIWTGEWMLCISKAFAYKILYIHYRHQYFKKRFYYIGPLLFPHNWGSWWPCGLCNLKLVGLNPSTVSVITKVPLNKVPSPDTAAQAPHRSLPLLHLVIAEKEFHTFQTVEDISNTMHRYAETRTIKSK